MKEKINQLARGNFEFELPKILVSSEQLQFEVNPEKAYEGEFEISNSKQLVMKGLIYSSDPDLVLLQSAFSGKSTRIPFRYKRKGEAITKASGTITIVSNFGEIAVPFQVTFVAPYVETTIGKIGTIKEFSELAKKNWDEALHIFLGPEFSSVLLKEDPLYQRYYECLLKSEDKNHGLEQFLCTTKQKAAISLEVIKKTFVYEEITESFIETIVLRKSQWGYLPIELEIQGDFLDCKTKKILGEAFVSDTYELEILIDKTKLHHGINVGTIVVCAPLQRIELSFSVKEKSRYQTKEQQQKHYNRLLEKKYTVKMIQNYLKFRLSQITKEEYVDTLETLIRSMNAVAPSLQNQLLFVHLYMVANRTEELKVLMDTFFAHEMELLEEPKEYYLGYLYIKALYTRKQEDILFALETLEEYEDRVAPLLIIWYRLQLEETLHEDRKLCLDTVLTACKFGMNSPILYYEACLCFNKEPQLLTELSEEIVHLLHWGVKNDAVSSGLAEQYVFLAGRKKYFDPILFGDLCLLYERYKTTECLQTICRMCMNGQKTDSRFFVWYDMAIKNQLKITELYEYYMYSLVWEKEVSIDQSVLLYFVYNNTLPDRIKANLYGYIIHHRDSIPTIYDTYLRQMTTFAKRSILKGQMSRALAYLYESLLDEGTLEEEIAVAMPSVLFKREVACEVEGIVAVGVKHKELIKEEIQPLNSKAAYLWVITEDALLFSLDERGNRYVFEEQMQITQMLSLKKFFQPCYEKNKTDLRLLLYRNEKLKEGHQKEKEEFFLMNRILESDAVSTGFKSSVYGEMMEYFYALGNLEKLDVSLHSLNLDTFPEEGRSKVIEHLIMRRLFDKALEAIVLYGYKTIARDRLQLLVDFYISVKEENVVINQICELLVEEGLASDTVLEYMIHQYSGPTKKMYELYEIGQKKQLDVVELEERLLGQMLFSQTMLYESYQVYATYQRHVKTKIMERAYLGYIAYQYLLHDVIVHESMFEVLLKEAYFYESKVIVLALLKYFSTKNSLLENECVFCDVNVHKFIKEGIVLPFFKAFKDFFDIPLTVYDKVYVEHKTNPKNSVSIMYAMVDETTTEPKFVTENLDPMFDGLFVKDFVLFYNEVLVYYIKEYDGTKEIISEEKQVRVANEEQVADSRYMRINQMLVSYEKKQRERLLEQMKHYVKDEYVMREVFTPL